MNLGTNSSKVTISLKKPIKEAYQRQADIFKMPLSQYLRRLLTEQAEAAEGRGELSAIEFLSNFEAKLWERADKARQAYESDEGTAKTQAENLAVCVALSQAAQEILDWRTAEGSKL